MSAQPTREYKEGFANGRADFALGFRSLYAWFAFANETQYHKDYSLGYRAGWMRAAEGRQS